MTKEEMQDELNRLFSLFGTAIFNRMMFLNMEIQKAGQKEAICQREKQEELGRLTKS